MFVLLIIAFFKLACSENCLECFNNYTCIQCIPRMFFDFDLNDCVPCSDNCSECASADDCISCAPDYELITDNIN